MQSYFCDVLGFKIAVSGLDSCLPYLALFIVTVIAGRVVDTVRQRRLASTVFMRKAGTVAAFVLAAAFLLLAGFDSGTWQRAVVCPWGHSLACSGRLCTYPRRWCWFFFLLCTLSAESVRVPGLLIPVCVCACVWVCASVCNVWCVRCVWCVWCVSVYYRLLLLLLDCFRLGHGWATFERRVCDGGDSRAWTWCCFVER